ncbi:DUF922 domain-containing protein [Croceitalea rosinachiae]|uniref:DUF922 domain-containing protein n=1 Tax=Croceitalea rosinachiae TaxID=3075596 RepID=A0ABU3AG85_9FLAO|nr:DUF922 domain-containing protein [Croceitalea sp. F388]MDT0608567.1 DUF922 domain-containing protein [Croceitalea sp. F388]
MDKKLKLIATLLLLGYFGSAQELEESVLWSADKRLTWSDFKGPIPPDAVPAATTASGISYKYSANLLHHEVKLDYTVNAYFYPNESWYKPDSCDDLILSHEQLHFDISELFARKMRLILSRTSFTENVKTEIRKIYKEILKELSDFQDKYDWETNFSRNREAQLEWNARIAEALSKIEN